MVFREMLEKLALIFLLLPAAGLVLVLALRWLLGWMDERGLIIYRNQTPVYRSVGNALVNLNTIYEPQKQFILEAQREELEEDGESGPDDPTRHLRRAAPDRGRRRPARQAERTAAGNAPTRNHKARRSQGRRGGRR